MSALTLSADTLTVTPGETATCEIRVRNNGPIVDQIRLRPLGPGAEWTTVEPELLNLFPDEEGTAVVMLRPPRATTVTAGETAFAVRAESREDPTWSEVVEGSVEVAGFTDTVAWLSPRTARGSRRGRYRLYVDNRGNQPVKAEIAVVDLDNLLTFDLPQSRVVTQPGTATVVKIRARAKTTFAKGPDQNRPFQVLVRSDLDEPIVADGALTQRQLLPTWLVPVAAMLVAGAVVLTVLWLTVLRPAVTTAARAKAQSEALAAEVGQAKAQAEQASQDANQAKQAVGLTDATPRPSAGPGAGGPDAGAGTGGPGGPGGGPGGAAGFEPHDFRIRADAPVAGGFHTSSFTVPADTTILITDIVLQNPLGDSGLLRIQRGSSVLIESGMDNFRDLDYHFVEPISFTAGQRVTLAVDCANGTGTACTPAVYFSGQIRKPASPSPSPTGR